MTNQQLTNIPPLILILCIVATFVGVMVYSYRKQRNSILGNLAAFLVIFWDDLRDKFGS